YPHPLRKTAATESGSTFGPDDEAPRRRPISTLLAMIRCVPATLGRHVILDQTTQLRRYARLAKARNAAPDVSFARHARASYNSRSFLSHRRSCCPRTNLAEKSESGLARLRRRSREYALFSAD